MLLAVLFLIGLMATGFKARDGMQNMPAVMSAIAKEDWALARQLIDEGADVNAPGPMGTSSMLFALRHKNLNAVKMLVEAGFDLDTPIKGKDILVYAKEMGNAEVLVYLESILISDLEL